MSDPPPFPEESHSLSRYREVSDRSCRPSIRVGCSRFMANRSGFLIFAIFLAEAEPRAVSDFVRDYLSEGFFWSPAYNVIDCLGQNEMEWALSVSGSRHGMVGLHGTWEDLRQWVDHKERQTFLLNLNCDGADSVLEQANASDLFRSPFQWLLVDHYAFDRSENAGTRQEWYWEHFEELNILMDSQVLVTVPADEEAVEIVGVYKPGAGRGVKMEKIGIWDPRGGLALATNQCATLRRWNLDGVPLTGSFVVTHMDTLNHLEDMIDKHIDPISKVGYVLIKHLSEMINVSLEMKIVNTWGVNNNGTWTGMIGDLQSGAVEVGISPAFVLEERMDVVNYYELITPTKAKFIFLSPPLTFSSNIFAMPFDRKVWLSSAVMAVVSCILLYLATKMEAQKRKRLETDGESLDERNDDLKGSFSDVLMLNVAAICMQGAVVEPKGPSGRIITLFFYFSCMFLYVSYSGSIVALLQSSDTSIRTFKDLLDSPLVVAADDVVYSQYYFKTESEPIRKALYEKKMIPKGGKPHFLPAEEGIENLRKGLYAYHVETSVGYSLIQKTFTEEEKCGLQEFSNSFFQNVDPLLAMRIRSPFTEHMRVGMKKIIETGLNHRSLSRIYTKKPICSAKGSRFVSVGLLDCYHAFVILLYGTCFSWFVLLLENLYLNRGRIFKGFPGRTSANVPD